MKKRLVFFWYIDKDLEFSPIYALHTKLLSRYSGIFDEALFVMSLKVDDVNHREMARRLASVLVGAGYRNSRFVFELNTDYREAKAFREYVHSSVVDGKSELIFFGHNKGMTNEITDSLIMWICSMYYFSLERVGDALRWLISERRCAYGFPVLLIPKNGDNPYCHPLNGFHYAGTMFWVNSAVSYMDVRAGFADVSHPFTDRFYAEDYAGNSFSPMKCGTYCNIGFYEGRMNFYENMDRNINLDFFDRIGDEALKGDFWEFYMTMKMEIGL